MATMLERIEAEIFNAIAIAIAIAAAQRRTDGAAVRHPWRIRRQLTATVAITWQM